MSRRLESIAIGACRRLVAGRRGPSPCCGVVRPYTSRTSMGSAASLQIESRRIRPAAVAFSINDHNAMVGNYQRRHFHITNVARDDKGGDAAAPAAAAQPDTSAAQAPFASPKVEALFQKIIWLDMVEVHLLAELINEKMGLTISDAERERMARGGGGGGGGGGKKEEEEAPVVEEKTVFDVKLTAFDAKTKIKVIKEVRAIAGLGLKEAKELVEGVPSFVRKNVKKEEAEELKAKLEELGATVEIV